MTRTECLTVAARTFVAGLALRDTLSPRQAAEAAWTPSGPSVAELEARIRASRGLQASEIAA